MAKTPLTRMRRAIAKSMTASAAIPQFTIEMTLDTAALGRLREECDPEQRPSYTDALVASVAKALRDHPTLNSSFEEDGIVEHEEVNVALAIALDGGLISPVIVNADRRSAAELATERKRLVEATRGGSLRPQELLSGTFTISNLGPFGVTRFGALVVPPQVGILAVGAMEGTAIVLSLSVDHRVVDGAPAARFLAQVKAQLEDPEWLSGLLAGDAQDRAATSRS